MKSTRRKKAAPRTVRKDLQDPGRDTRGPREGSVESDAECSDRDAGAGRPVQLDEERAARRGGSPQPSDDAPPAK